MTFEAIRFQASSCTIIKSSLNILKAVLALSTFQLHRGWNSVKVKGFLIFFFLTRGWLVTRGWLATRGWLVLRHNSITLACNSATAEAKHNALQGNWDLLLQIITWKNQSLNLSQLRKILGCISRTTLHGRNMSESNTQRPINCLGLSGATLDLWRARS